MSEEFSEVVTFDKNVIEVTVISLHVRNSQLEIEVKKIIPSKQSFERPKNKLNKKDQRPC